MMGSKVPPACEVPLAPLELLASPAPREMLGALDSLDWTVPLGLLDPQVSQVDQASTANPV